MKKKQNKNSKQNRQHKSSKNNKNIDEAMIRNCPCNDINYNNTSNPLGLIPVILILLILGILFLCYVALLFIVSAFLIIIPVHLMLYSAYWLFIGLITWPIANCLLEHAMSIFQILKQESD